MPAPENHFDRLHRLLQLEADAEAQKTLRDARHLTPTEAEAAGRSLINLVVREEAAGLASADIAVITPYAAQARLLREQLPDPELEVDTVDGFQGREKEAVVVSLVRSNREGEIGFLADVRRMNVALTRTRRKLLMNSDSATITTHPFYQRLVNYFEGRVRIARFGKTRPPEPRPCQFRAFNDSAGVHTIAGSTSGCAQHAKRYVPTYSFCMVVLPSCSPKALTVNGSGP